MNENNYSHALLKAMTKVITFILANCLGIAFFLQSHFSRFTQFLGFSVLLLKENIFKVFRFLVTILVLLVKLMAHIWFGVYKIKTQHIYWTNLVKFKPKCGA